MHDHGAACVHCFLYYKGFLTLTPSKRTAPRTCCWLTRRRAAQLVQGRTGGRWLEGEGRAAPRRRGSAAPFFFLAPSKNKAERKHSSDGHSSPLHTTSSQIRRTHTSLTTPAPSQPLLIELHPPPVWNRATHLLPLLPPPS